MYGTFILFLLPICVPGVEDMYLILDRVKNDIYFGNHNGGGQACTVILLRALFIWIAENSTMHS